MAPRVDSELLLVGSLPADSADSALRAAAGFYGDLVFALPDGETGPRRACPAPWTAREISCSRGPGGAGRITPRD